ncbi:hypothetical protein O5D80_007469 [Batrachochytrium dendrobatidis]|nr:hypothetical protein O5D80_007469 [Batrachochytrium dendrobatidis]
MFSSEHNSEIEDSKLDMTSSDMDDYETRQKKQAVYDILHNNPSSLIQAIAQSGSISRIQMEAIKSQLLMPSPLPTDAALMDVLRQGLDEARLATHGTTGMVESSHPTTVNSTSSTVVIASDLATAQTSQRLLGGQASTATVIISPVDMTLP